jgi:hypothetical protein
MENYLYYPIMFLLCHFVPDFWLQTDWMAMNKSKKSWNCFVHVLIYTFCFLVLTTSWKALLFIGVTHFILDRWHVILRRMIWWKNHFPTFKYPPFKYCNTTGYYDDSPHNTYYLIQNPKNAFDNEWNKSMIEKYGQPRLFFITMWLYIIQDNLLHLVCNLIALTLLVS